jgi:hypothetical protein
METPLFQPLLLKEETIPTFRFCIYQSSRHHLLAFYCFCSWLWWMITLFYGVYEIIYPSFLMNVKWWALYTLLLFFSSLMPLFFLKIQHRYVLSITLLPEHKVSVQTWSLWNYQKKVFKRKDCLCQPSHFSVRHAFAIPRTWMGLKHKQDEVYWIDTEGEFPYGMPLFREVFAEALFVTK